MPSAVHRYSLADVIYAVQCVRTAGIVVEGCRAWHCTSWYQSIFDWLLPHDEPISDQASTGVFCTASSVVHPDCRNYTLYKKLFTDYPKTIVAFIRWASPSLERLDMWDSFAENSPSFWQGYSAVPG